MPAKIRTENRLHAEAALLNGHKVHCNEWRYELRNGRVVASRQHTLGPIEHTFDSVTEGLTDLHFECGGQWPDVYYFERG